jgi:hypothetical protein
MTPLTIFRPGGRLKPIAQPPLSAWWRCSAERMEWWPVSVAQRDYRQDLAPGGDWPGWAVTEQLGAAPASSSRATQVGLDVPPPARRLALFGLPSALAEPVTMLAEILGWQVESFPPGQSVCPPARLCLAMLPATTGERGPIAAWSPELNLNELISAAGLSIMDQPLCITRVEQMLETIACEP